jgi:hypothetical protein
MPTDLFLNSCDRVDPFGIEGEPFFDHAHFVVWVLIALDRIFRGAAVRHVKMSNRHSGRVLLRHRLYRTGRAWRLRFTSPRRTITKYR